MKVGGLFGGIGMFERACVEHGIRLSWTCENDDFCRRILDFRYPDTEHLGDVLEVDAGAPEIDMLVGGFPCQGASSAGNQLGLADPRTGLWSEFARLIGDLRPRLVVIENVAALRSRGMKVVLGDLLARGYDAYWDCVPALAVGAPHLRDRVWIVAALAGTIDLPEAKGPVENLEKLPRAGVASGFSIRETTPRATVRMCKEAMGARREGSVTWLTRVGYPLFPTPTANDDNKSPEAHLAMKARLGGGARRKITSLSVLAQAGFPDDMGTAMSHEMFPTAEDAADVRGQGVAKRLWPTATSHPRTHTPRDVHHGAQLANEVDAEERRASLWPSPSAATAQQGPGREGRAGGPNLRTAVAERDRPGPLSPYWVSWLMGIPIGWVDPECEEPVQLDWSSEYGIPRVLPDVPLRKQQLQALGNALVWQVAYVMIGDALSRMR